MSAELSSGYVPEGEFDDFNDQTGPDTEAYGYDGMTLHIQELAIATKLAVDGHAQELSASQDDIEDTQDTLGNVLSQAMNTSHFHRASPSGLTETSRILYEMYGYPEGVDRPVEDTGPETMATEEIGFSAKQATIALEGINRQLEIANTAGSYSDQRVLLGATNWIMENLNLPDMAAVTEYEADESIEEHELLAA